MSIFKRTQRKYVKKAYRVRNWREYEAGVPSIYSSASPWIGSHPCGAKYPRFCADSKSV